jgi:PQQ-like domain
MKRYWDYIVGRRQTHVAVAAVVALALCGVVREVHAATRLLPQEELRQLGLVRAWFAQVRLDRSRNHLERAVLDDDQLTVLTNAGVVQQLNALTGETLWVAPIGNENYPSLGPACSDKYVALVNGSTLYVLDRVDGRPVLIRRIGGAPGAAPAISSNHVFVPLLNGRIEGYPLMNEKQLTPWYYQSYGRTMVAPLATPESIVWATETGYLYVGNSVKPGMRFRLETGSEIVAPPTYRKPFVYVAATSGEVFAMQEMTGAREWKYASGFPVTRAVAPVGERVFATSEEPRLHCIDAKSGGAVWEAPHVSQFAAASKQRVYGVDDLGAFVVLDGAKGTLLGRIVTDHLIKSLVNDQTDRVYLISDNGLVECLREADAKEPLYHNPKVEESKKDETGSKPAGTAPKPKPLNTAAEATTTPAQPPAEKKPAQPNKPAGDFGVKDSDNPFGN